MNLHRQRFGSRTVRIWSASTEFIRCTMPLGQVISSDRTFRDVPKPKCTRYRSRIGNFPRSLRRRVALTLVPELYGLVPRIHRDC